MTTATLKVGKIRSAGTKYPWEPGYIQSIREQFKDLEKILNSIMEQFGDVSEDIMLDALKPTFEKAKGYTPKDKGVLVGSAYLEKTGTKARPRVEMGFARGGNPHYAVLVHEDLQMYHQPPTQAKFLERAMEEDLVDIAVNIGKGYQRFMRNG